MLFQKSDGSKIYYEIHGQDTGKEPILLLHHGIGCANTWKEIYPDLVYAGYKVIIYDRRGFGESEKGPDFMDFYKSDRYRPESVDELSALLDFLGINRFHLIGQCEGGVVSLDYAAKFPNQVLTLTTSSTQCFSGVPMVEKNAHDFPKIFRELEPVLQAKLMEWQGEGAEEFFNQFSQFGGAYGKNVFDLRPVLSSVTCPSLVLYPDRSALFTVEQGVSMYRGLPKGELSVLPGCGHNTYQYRPKEYVRIVLDFLGRHEDRDAGVNEGEMVGMSCLAVKKSPSPS
jgi:pimeloyl-ACP methyl ester carboxylesterase